MRRAPFLSLPLPPDFSHAKSWAASPVYCYRDAAKTLPCGDGDLIYVIVNRLGTGPDLIQATAANRPVLRQLTDGNWAIFGNGFNTFMTFASGLSVDSQLSSIWIGYYPLGASSIPVPIDLGSSSQLTFFTKQTPNTVDPATVYLLTSSTDVHETTQIIDQRNFNIVALIQGSLNAEVRVNGVFELFPPASSFIATGGTLLADDASLAFVSSVAVTEILIYDLTQDNTASLAVEAYYGTYSYQPFAFPINVNLVACHGNSIVWGVNVVTTGDNYLSWPALLNGHLTNQVIVLDLGIASASTASNGSGFVDLTAAAPVSVDPFLNVLRTNNVCIFQEIHNDILLNTVSGATAYSNCNAYGNARKAVGWKVICADCLPSTLLAGANEVARLLCNSDLSGDYPTATANPYVFLPGLSVTAFDVLVRLSDIPGITYSDGTHPTAAGYVILADAFAFALSLVGVT